MTKITLLREVTAALSVDVAKTFMPGGGLPVLGGDEIVTPSVELLRKFEVKKRFACLDQHKEGSISLASSYIGYSAFHQLTLAEVRAWAKSNLAPHALFTWEDLIAYLEDVPGNYQWLWPDHGIGEEAELHPAFRAIEFNEVLIKGLENPKCDSYSAFSDNLRCSTGFGERIWSQGNKNLIVWGLAGDICAAYTAEDAVKQGFGVYLVEDLCRNVDNPPGAAQEKKNELIELGVNYITSNQITLMD